MDTRVEELERQFFLEKDVQADAIDEHLLRKLKRWRMFAVCLTAICILQTAWMLMRDLRIHQRESYEAGFETDLDTFTPLLKLTRTRFTGALHPDDNGDLVMITDPNQPKYVGASEEEMDRHWDELIADRYFAFTDREASQLDNAVRLVGSQHANLSSVTIGSTTGGIDMFHSLHCLDSLRRMTGNRTMKSYERLQSNYLQLHVDHCVEQLRQAILCHGDLTPVTLTPVLNSQRGVLQLLGQTEYFHTCRDWKAVKEAVSRRGGLGFDLNAVA